MTYIQSHKSGNTERDGQRYIIERHTLRQRQTQTQIERGGEREKERERERERKRERADGRESAKLTCSGPTSSSGCLIE